MQKFHTFRLFVAGLFMVASLTAAEPPARRDFDHRSELKSTDIHESPC